MDITGTWDVVASPDFDESYLNEEGTPYVSFSLEGQQIVGTYQVGLQAGQIVGRRMAGDELLFSFEGMDELEPVHGAGTIRLEGDRLIFTLMYHDGDDYAFECERRP